MKTAVDREALSAAWKRLAEHYASQYPLCETAHARFPSPNVEGSEWTISYSANYQGFFRSYGPSISRVGYNDMGDLTPLQQSHFMQHIGLLEEAIKKVDSAPSRVLEAIDQKLAERPQSCS